MRHCFHSRPRPDCDVCRRYDSDAAYRAFSDRAAARLRLVAPPAGECVHLGKPAAPPAGRPAGRRWSLCGHPAAPLGPVVCPCDGCGPGCGGYRVADRELPPALRRNLLFHLYPIRGKWHWHADRLRKVAPLFNGRKLVAVATSDHCDPWEAVADALPGFEVLAVRNDPSLREVATFEPLFGSMTPAPDEVTLYAQGKGVTHDFDPVFMRWTEILYETLCDHWPAVEDVLRRYPLAGSFLKVGRGWADFESLSEWHYSGSWFWFRNRELLSKPDWRRIDRFWSGIEPYPSLHFGAEEAGVVFFRGKVPTLQFYPTRQPQPFPTGQRFLSEVVEPQYAAWRKANEARRTNWEGLP